MRVLSQSNSARLDPEGYDDLPFALAELLRGSYARAGGLEVTGINADSRAILPGEAFFAIPGTRVHGNDFIAQAVQRGAVAVVSDREPGSAPGVPVIVVRDVRAA